MGEMRYEISQRAYIKLILHVIKQKTTAVNGILVGKYSGEVVHISDALPLSHSHIALLPTLQIALIQIEECYGAQGLGIVGYFHANERLDDLELSNVAKNIGDHIHRYFQQAALLLLDNEKLEALFKGKDRSPVMQLYARGDSSKSWKIVGTDDTSRLHLKEPSANVVLLDYISSRKWEQIVDFDDHLDDISKDWTNSELFNEA